MCISENKTTNAFHWIPYINSAWFGNGQDKTPYLHIVENEWENKTRIATNGTRGPMWNEILKKSVNFAFVHFVLLFRNSTSLSLMAYRFLLANFTLGPILPIYWHDNVNSVLAIFSFCASPCILTLFGFQHPSFCLRIPNWQKNHDSVGEKSWTLSCYSTTYSYWMMCKMFHIRPDHYYNKITTSI